MDYTELVFRPGLVMLTLDAEAKHSSEKATPVPPSEGSLQKVVTQTKNTDG